MPSYYLRHGVKAWGNGCYEKVPHFDPPLIETKILKESIQKLYNSGFRPKQIITSPYRRCRETAAIAAKIFGFNEIFSDENLSEYLNEKWKIKFDTNYFEKETLDLGIVGQESFWQYRWRSLCYCFEDDTLYVGHRFMLTLKIKKCLKMGEYAKVL